MSAMDGGVRALLARAAERVTELLGHDDNVTGVSVGYRQRGGRRTDEPVVTVMVRKKRRPGLVSRRRLIPAAIDVDGTLCPTDVVQAQAVLMSANGWPGLLRGRYRPLRFGCGVSNANDPSPDAGTLGAIVRDRTDRTVGILSANHVIADNNSAPVNDTIFQPAELDYSARHRERPETTVVARLKRWVEITGGATAVDAAIAEVDEGVAVHPQYEGVEFGVVKQDRPAIGMLVAGDGFGNVWLTNMATTLEELEVTLLSSETGEIVEATPPEQWVKLEKVGRTTSYTAGRALVTGESVRVEVPGVGVVTYTELIRTQWMGWNGDSGSMVLKHELQGDPMEEPREIESRERISEYIRNNFETCEVLPAIQYAFEVPITEDAELSDEVRDAFMSQTETGRFLITLTYLNTTLVNERLETRQSREQQAYARSLYETYQPIITDMMTDPNSPHTLDEVDRENYFELLQALYEGGVLTWEEYMAAYNLGRTHEGSMQGMGRDEVMTYMNQVETLVSVRETTLEMEALVQHGTPVVMSAVRAPRGLV
jgi:hypothetical protein